MTVLEKLRLSPKSVASLCAKHGITTKPPLSSADREHLEHNKGRALKVRRKYKAGRKKRILEKKVAPSFAAVELSIPTQ